MKAEISWHIGKSANGADALDQAPHELVSELESALLELQRFIDQREC